MLSYLLNPDVPPVRLALLGRHQRRRRLLALFTPARNGAPAELGVTWRSEATSTGVHLMGGLLHEAAHSIGHTRGIPTVSGTNGTHHTWLFNKLAAEVGLIPSDERPDHMGWDEPGSLAQRHYRPQITRLDRALEAGRGG